MTVAQGLVFSFFSHNFFLLVRPNWKSLADFPFQDPFRLLILAIWPSSLFQLFGCPPFLYFSQIVGIFYCWVESSLLAASTYCFFSSLVPCGTAHLFMNVYSILSDSSLHDWALRTQLFFSAVVILFGLCYTPQGSPSSGILWDPSPVPPIGLLLAYWLWPTGPFFCFMEF